MIKLTKYVKNPLIVEGVQITEENFFEIAEWCQGNVRRIADDASVQDSMTGVDPKTVYIRIRVLNPITPRQSKAYVGDWVLVSERGYKIYNNSSFLNSFSPLPSYLEKTQAS